MCITINGGILLGGAKMMINLHVHHLAMILVTTLGVTAMVISSKGEERKYEQANRQCESSKPL